MKKLLLSLALLTGFVMVGCTEDTPDTTPDPIFETNVEQNFVVYEEGANIEVEVRTNLEYSVVIPANVTWVTHVETRALRNETLVFSVAPYDGSSSRGTTISLVGADGAMLQSIVIVQNVRTIELIADRDKIYLGESVNFTVTYRGEDITSECTIYDQNNKAIEGATFTPDATGTYSFYAKHDKYPASSKVSVEVKDGSVLLLPEDHNPSNIAFHHRVVLIDHTGVNCGNCPTMTSNLIKYHSESEWGDFYNEVTCHAGSFAGGDPANSAAADALNAFQGNRGYFRGYPSLCINLHGANVSNYSYSTFVNYMTDALQGSVNRDGAQAGIAMVVDKGEGSVICKAQIKAAKYSEYRVNAWLLESDIYSPGQASATKPEHKIYNHALRSTSESVSEADFSGKTIGYIEAGMIRNYDCEIAVDPSWNIDNTEVLMVVMAKNIDGIWEVVNSANCPVGKSLPYRYVGEPESIGDAVYGDSTDDGNSGEKLATPEVTLSDVTETGFTASWGAIENATSYAVMLNGVKYETTQTSYRFENLNRGEYRVLVMASAKGYSNSEYSNAKSLTLTGPTSIDWFTQSVALVEDNDANAKLGLNSSNAFTYTWKGEGVADIQYELFPTAELPKTYEEIISKLHGAESAVVEQVNADGYTSTYKSLSGGTSYTLCTYVTNEIGVKFLEQTEITTTETIITPAVEAWLGEWSAYTDEAYNFDKGTLYERQDFTFTVTADEDNSGYVFVDGLSVQGRGVPAYAHAYTGENGEYILGIINGYTLEDYGKSEYAMWMSYCDLLDENGNYNYMRQAQFQSFYSISLIMNGDEITCKLHEGMWEDYYPFRVYIFDLFIVNLSPDRSGFYFFTDERGNEIKEFRAGAYKGITRVK